jgi:phosphoenolpyruvate synthase/pyruvate phosphate dikinase
LEGYEVAYVIHPNTTNLSLEEIGIKSAALGHMERIGLPVPPFRVLTAGFFEKHASNIGLGEKISFLKEEIIDYKEIGKHISKIVSESKLSEQLVEELAFAVEQIKSSTIDRMDQSMSFAVRISKPYLSTQDSKIRLHLQGLKEIEEAVISAFADHFSEASIDERVSKGIDALAIKIPLIIQQFIKPDVTGIILPYSKETPNEYYIVAWKGFGFEMNFHFCDHYVVNHKDLMLKRFLNNKTGEVVFFDETKNSITKTQIIHSEASIPFLSHNDIVGLCEVYSNHKDNLGGLGIEFKIKKNRIVMISLKDESTRIKAEKALEDLRELANKVVPEKTEIEDVIENISVEEVSQVEDVSVDDIVSNEHIFEKDDNVYDIVDSKSEDRHHEQTDYEATPETRHRDIYTENHHRTLSEEVSENVMPHMTIEASSDDALLIDDGDVTEDNDDDLMAHIDSICEKYIIINPSLEKVIRMLQEDIKSTINLKGSR